MHGTRVGGRKWECSIVRKWTTFISSCSPLYSCTMPMYNPCGERHQSTQVDRGERSSMLCWYQIIYHPNWLKRKWMAWEETSAINMFHVGQTRGWCYTPIEVNGRRSVCAVYLSILMPREVEYGFSVMNRVITWASVQYSLFTRNLLIDTSWHGIRTELVFTPCTLYLFSLEYGNYTCLPEHGRVGFSR